MPEYPSIQRSTPSPFQRPSVNLGGSVDLVRREWQTIPAGQLRAGDILPGVGGITLIRRADDDIHIEGGVEQRVTFHAMDLVYAFTATA